MNHLDFVIWLIGWGYFIGQQVKLENKFVDGIKMLMMFIAWIGIAILIY